VSVTEAVVNVIPLYIIVTEGHMLLPRNEASLLGKQYCSIAEDADADTGEPCKALLPPKRAQPAKIASKVIFENVRLGLDGRESYKANCWLI